MNLQRPVWQAGVEREGLRVWGVSVALCGEPWEPDTEATGGMWARALQPPGHRDMLPAHPTTAFARGQRRRRTRLCALTARWHRWGHPESWAQHPTAWVCAGQIERSQGAKSASLPRRRGATAPFSPGGRESTPLDWPLLCRRGGGGNMPRGAKTLCLLYGLLLLVKVISGGALWGVL